MLAIAEETPFTMVCKVLVLVANTLVVFEALIAASDALALGDRTSGPLMVVVPFKVDDVAVNGPLMLVVARLVVPVALRLAVLVVPKEAIFEKRLVKTPVTACTNVEKILLAVRFWAVVVPFNLIPVSSLIVVVVATPFTVEVRVLVEVANDKLLVVPAAIALASEVVAVIPFRVDDSTTPEVERTLELMIEVDEATPFTLVVMMLAEEETAFDEMTELVAVTPLMVVVKVLPDRD